MGSNKGKPSITKCRLTNNGRFREFDEMVKYKGTYRMREELDYFRELAIQTAAKGFNSLYLRDNQEIFLTKLEDGGGKINLKKNVVYINKCRKKLK
jgi:hypothetical protein